MTGIEALLVEYFALKDEDRAIRAERNAYMKDHTCTNTDRTYAGEDGGDYDCITRRIDGHAGALCDVCEQRNLWYSRRHTMSIRRGQIMRRLKRLVTVAPATE